MNLRGAQNFADLALIRGAAEFTNDFDDEAVKERMRDMYICYKHQQELVFNWEDSTDPVHSFTRRTARGKKAACTVPNDLDPDLNMHGPGTQLPLAKAGRFLQRDKALTFLKRFGAHLHIGIRESILICML